jgi:chromosome segregation ATPase
MGVGDILGGLKDKVLDAAHFELLKHAYDLQEQNIQQLKSNNAAIKEAHDLLQEKVRGLVEANRQLQEEVASLTLRLPLPEPDANQLSEVAIQILAFCKINDLTDAYGDVFYDNLGYSKIEIDAAIDELEKAGLLDIASVGMRGTNYYLTDTGKRFVLTRLE